ncbi:hypothetical protein QMZ93_01435 [Pantoea stewartii subsp. indologenes]|uniref:hypothetical protein n=1 Tax=Pantoea stewartii TaxID=66269 RepID=UPI001980CBE9|nr:hypothetical protein [Pantoea stewartii]MDK2632010.1 hypothetical protein [Pantoea stewartii subsp. indologenes]
MLTTGFSLVTISACVKQAFLMNGLSHLKSAAFSICLLFLAFILALNVLVKGNPFRFDRETAMMRDRTARSQRRKYQAMPSVTVMSVKTGIESIVKTVTGFDTVTPIQDERFR